MGALAIQMVTFDTTDPDRLAAWWADALGATVATVAAGEFVLVIAESGPRLGFQRVDAPTTGKNRAHLDFHTADLEPEVQRLVGLGATEIERHSFGDFGWVVLTDPDGNVFCVAAAD